MVRAVFDTYTAWGINYEIISCPPPQTALLRLHELALQNRLVEKFDPTADPAGGFVVKLTLGNESYSGRGNTIKAAKQNAAMQALVTTKYKAMSTMKARPDGVTATSQG